MTQSRAWVQVRNLHPRQPNINRVAGSSHLLALPQYLQVLDCGLEACGHDEDLLTHH